MTQIIDGKKIAQTTLNNIECRVKKYQQTLGCVPHLAVIIVGDDPASQVYVGAKEKTAQSVGIKSTVIRLSQETSQHNLVEIITQLNHDNDVDGILVQLPLPKHFNEQDIIHSISPNKDVDGFHPVNVGYLHSGCIDKALLPCTPSGCIILLKSVCADLSGKNALVIGRSHIVGRPIAEMLLAENCTVTIAHSKTKNISELCKQADIIIAAVGKAHFVKAEWVKNDAIIIDVGINRIMDISTGKNKLVGDVDFDALKEKCYAITPVPGGVGPMTIACLLANTLKAFEIKNNQIHTKI